MKNNSLRISYAGLFLALGLVLPFITGQIPDVGNMLLPMHLAIMLCGLVCGPFYGAIIGFITPILRSLLFSMPPLFPHAFAMAFELATYGLVIGYIYILFKKRVFGLYFALIISMILGRIVWGFASVIFYGLAERTFTFALFIAGAFTKAIPGIILQLVLVPLIVTIFEKYLKNDKLNG